MADTLLQQARVDWRQGGTMGVTNRGHHGRPPRSWALRAGKELANSRPRTRKIDALWPVGCTEFAYVDRRDSASDI